MMITINIIYTYIHQTATPQSSSQASHCMPLVVDASYPVTS